MFSKIALLLFGLSACLAATQVSFTGNVSGDVSSRGWQYRRTSLNGWPGPFNLGGDYTSVYVQRQGKTITADVIYGACAFSTSALNPYPPRTFVASFSGTDDWTGSNFANGNVSSSRGFIGAAYLALAESDPNGNYVNNASLGNNKMSWSRTDSGNNGALKWITYTGTPVSMDPWEISFTFVVSDVAGIINQGGATVTPTSIESIVNISGWQYQNSANSLNLFLLVATGASRFEGNNLFSGSDSDASQVSFGLASQAEVDGDTKDVTISSWTDADMTAISDPGFAAQVENRYGSVRSIKLVHVTFPAGANAIMYDPTIAATSTTASGASSAVRSAAFGITILALLFALLF